MNTPTIKKILLPEIVSDGITGEGFIKNLIEQKFTVSELAKKILLHREFVPTKGIKYKPVVLFGSDITNDVKRTTQHIHQIAKMHGYIKPHMEVAPILRSVISDEKIKKMGLKVLVILSKGIKGPGGSENVLGLDTTRNGKTLFSYYAPPHWKWLNTIGFVFLVP